jgi:uncharacterized protein (DUF2249 family)
MSGPESTDRIVAEFDQLGPDQALLIRGCGDPTALLQLLQSERRDVFDWHLLESNPEEYRVEIWRRRVGTRGTVGEFMDQDHRRLERLVSELERQVAQRTFDRASERLRDLRAGLSRHIGIEERVLYPAFQRVHGAGAGLVHSLESEHSILLSLLAEIDAALIARDEEGARLALADMRGILVPHGRNETTWIYPVIDISGTHDAAGLVRSMQSLSAN